MIWYILVTKVWYNIEYVILTLTITHFICIALFEGQKGRSSDAHQTAPLAYNCSMRALSYNMFIATQTKDICNMLCIHDNTGIWCKFILRKYYVMYSIVYNLKLLHFEIQVNWIASSFPPTVSAKIRIGTAKISVISYTYDIIMRCDPSITCYDKKPRVYKLYIMVERTFTRESVAFSRGQCSWCSGGFKTQGADHEFNCNCQYKSAMGLAVRSGYWIVIKGIVVVILGSQGWRITSWKLGQWLDEFKAAEL